jgi:CHAT domain-containing protein
MDPPPVVLHLATHGYFCPKAKFSGGARIYENPLLYSGLVLSGVNRFILDIEQTSLQPMVDDGVLTSLEVSGLNLVGTDLVVLSACRTGLGEIKYGEGVFGLRRSFQHAGAGTIVMSLWDIPDNETVELMEDFYGRWLSGESKSTALRNAALSVLCERRKYRGTAHPLFWGGFVLVGNPN